MNKPLLHFCTGTAIRPVPTARCSTPWAALRRARHRHGRPRPALPGGRQLARLVDELIAELERYGAGDPGRPFARRHAEHDGGRRRPELARCVVMLDSPVVAGWRALAWRLVKLLGKGSRFRRRLFRTAPQRLARPRRRATSTSCRSRSSRPGRRVCWTTTSTTAWPASGRRAAALRPRGRDAIYNSLPHHLGAVLREPFRCRSASSPAPVGRAAPGRLASTRKLVGENFVMIEGTPFVSDGVPAAPPS
jgi:hypothetical protein